LEVFVTINISSGELECRKQRIRDLWNYRKLDHIPIIIISANNPWRYSFQDQLRSSEKQLAVQLKTIEKTLASVPDDFIPVLQPNMADASEVAVSLGADLFWGTNLDQSPVATHMIHCDEDVYKLPTSGWEDQPIVQSWVERIKFFVQESDWPLTLNLRGPTDTSWSISDGVWFFSSMKTSPQIIEHVYDLATKATCAIVDRIIGAVGRKRVVDLGARHWCPEGHEGYVSDDVATSVSPDFFDRMNLHTNDKIFGRYGQGIFHICGPHPSANLYLGGQFPPHVITASWRYTLKYLQRLSQALAGKAVLYLELTDYETWQEADFSPLIARYQQAVDIFIPTTLLVPVFTIGEQVDGAALYAAARKISEFQARQMQWVD